jgi:hypothetical protein
MKRRQFLSALFATAGAGALMGSGTAWGLTLPAGLTLPLGLSGLISGVIGKLPITLRDQGMGSTDLSGFVAFFPLQSGAMQIWMDAEQGSTSYNGLSPYPGFMLNGTGPNFQIDATGPGTANAAYGPKSTYASGLAAVPESTGGMGHQFFFAEGQTFVLDRVYLQPSYWRDPYSFYGNGAKYPACFQSFDPADPLNITKHGRAGTGSQGARPIWKQGTTQFPQNANSSTFDYGGWAFRGIELLSEGNGQGIVWAGQSNNVLYENVTFNNVVLTIEDNISFSTGIGLNNIVRLCTSYGQYDVNGSNACGIFSAYTNLTIEDCVFWHCGWKVGVSRDAPVEQGGPNIYKHCIYLDNHRGSTSTVRRNVIVDGSAGGLSLRGNHLCHHNVIIDCPTPDIMSGGSGTDLESPAGVTQQSFCQLIMGGADISSSQPRCMGFRASDGTPNSFYAYNLYVNNPGYGQVNNRWLLMENEIPAQISNMGFYHNRAYAFAPPAKRLTLGTVSGGSVSSINVYADVDNLIFASSPMTNDAIYAAVGYAGKDAIVQAMIKDASQNWASRLLLAAGSGFAFNFNYSPV